MAKPSAVLQIAERIAHKIISEQTRVRVMLGFDAAMIAANKCFNMGPSRVAKFAQCYNEAMEELAVLFVSDVEGNGDKRMEYAKGKRDEIMKRFMGDSFTEFDAAYGYTYADELRRIRLMREERADEAEQV